MNYVISIINERLYKAYYKIILAILASMGLVDFVLYFSRIPVMPWLRTLMLGILIGLLVTNTVKILKNIQSVHKYFFEQLELDLRNKFRELSTKGWDSNKNDLLFAVSDGMHQGLSFKAVNRCIKGLSRNDCSLTLKKRRDDGETCFDLTLWGYDFKPKKIIYITDLERMRKIAENKLQNSIDKYLTERGIRNGNRVLESVLFGLRWISETDINRYIDNHNRSYSISHFGKRSDLAVETHHHRDERIEYVEFCLLDKGEKVTATSIYQKELDN